ncbi:hypothetical protein QOT17_010071 [Balamuthia mandrillaris]
MGRLLDVAVVGGLGVATGYFVFKPIVQELQKSHVERQKLIELGLITKEATKEEQKQVARQLLQQLKQQQQQQQPSAPPSSSASVPSTPNPPPPPSSS